MTELGATGEYPNGKLTDEDEGALVMSVGTHENTVIINFGKPVHWFGLPKDEALALANLITQRANEL